MKPVIRSCLCLMLVLLASCSNASKPFSLSVKALTGERLTPPSQVNSGSNRENLQHARLAYDQDPNDLDNIIWLGRRTAYLWRYREAIDIYTKGLDKHPNSPELYRHRGHRYISIRQFGRAIKDLERAAELVVGRPLQIEPDGIPNRLNQPLSSLQFNIYYHLGLGYFFKGDFADAATAFESCLEWSVNPDLKVATIDWLYMTHQRLGEPTKAREYLAQVSRDWELVENDSYFQRVLLYKGDKKPEDLLQVEGGDLESELALVTQGYGVANYYYYNGQKNKALALLQRIRSTNYWSAFGYIAAEAELARW